MDLETLWIEASGEERAQYLRAAWIAADPSQRAAVLREEDASWVLEAAWIAASGRQRMGFVAIRARAIASALDEALVLPPPDRPAKRESKTALARRLNALEMSRPELAEIIRSWRLQLGVPLKIKRGLPPPDRPARTVRYRDPNRPRMARKAKDRVRDLVNGEKGPPFPKTETAPIPAAPVASGAQPAAADDVLGRLGIRRYGAK